MVRAGIRERTTGSGSRPRSVAVALLLAVATLLAGAASPLPAEASSATSALERGTVARAQAIRARIDARYRSVSGLAVTEATSTGVLESYALLTPDLQGSRVVSADSGIYFAICPVRATCPYPAARYARPAADLAPRRLALELALRAFLETSADLVVVSLPTSRYVAFVVVRAELAREVDLPALATALGGDPSRVLAPPLAELVDRVTRPRIFVALGLEPTPSGRSSWAGVPQWPTAPAGGERALLATSAPSPIRFELDLGGVPRPGRPGNVLAIGSRPAGTFRSGAPYCAAGSVLELRRGLSGRWITTDRRFTCSDGSGSVTARMWLMGMDEGARFEEGVWRIVAGTGVYTTLRGMGAYTRALVDGEGGATAREVWAGDADFDAVAPRVGISAISVGRAVARDGSHVVLVALTAKDGEHGSGVDFIVSARNRFLLAAKSGRIVSGAAAVALRVRPGTGGRTIRLKVEATDRVGNATTVVRTLTLPGSRHRSSRTPDSFPRREA